MTRPGTLKHFINFVWRDSSNKIFIVFSCAAIFVGFPSMYLIDRMGMRHKLQYLPDGYQPSWAQTAVIVIIGLVATYAIILAYTYWKYKKYINNKL